MLAATGRIVPVRGMCRVDHRMGRSRLYNSKTVRRDGARPAAADLPVAAGPIPRAGFPSQARGIVSDRRFSGKSQRMPVSFQG